MCGELRLDDPPNPASIDSMPPCMCGLMKELHTSSRHYYVSLSMNLISSEKTSTMALSELSMDDELGVDSTRRCGRDGCNSTAYHRCAGCRLFYYCCRECQQAAWPTHMKSCKKIKEMAHGGQKETVPAQAFADWLIIAGIKAPMSKVEATAARLGVSLKDAAMSLGTRQYFSIDALQPDAIEALEALINKKKKAREPVGVGGILCTCAVLHWMDGVKACLRLGIGPDSRTTGEDREPCSSMAAILHRFSPLVFAMPEFVDTTAAIIKMVVENAEFPLWLAGHKLRRPIVLASVIADKQLYSVVLSAFKRTFDAADKPLNPQLQRALDEALWQCTISDGPAIVTKVLLDCGADPDVKDERGVSLVDEICNYQTWVGTTQKLRLLARAGANFNVISKHSTSALGHAVITLGSVEIFDLLLELGALPATLLKAEPDVGGMLCKVAWANNVPMMKRLVEMRLVDVNTPYANSGSPDVDVTALYAASQWGLPEMVAYLLSAGADPTIGSIKLKGKRIECDNAVTFAITKGHVTVVQVMMDAGAVARELPIPPDVATTAQYYARLAVLCLQKSREDLEAMQALPKLRQPPKSEIEAQRKLVQRHERVLSLLQLGSSSD